VESTPTTLPIATIVDGKALYAQKCVSCHGMKAEKSALGKSQIIANFTEQQTKDALKGYQDGSYGKEMKGLMQGQVKSLNLEQIDALAHYITTL
ncbi:MAG: c-type cytochrome, partial [Sulfuricurvum sp.]